MWRGVTSLWIAVALVLCADPGNLQDPAHWADNRDHRGGKKGGITDSSLTERTWFAYLNAHDILLSMGLQVRGYRFGIAGLGLQVWVNRFGGTAYNDDFQLLLLNGASGASVRARE